MKKSINKIFTYLWTRKDKIIGYIFLIPPLIGVNLFIDRFFNSQKGLSYYETFIGKTWGGIFDNSGIDGGFATQTSIFLGLMALAGAYLITNSKVNRNK
jgi:hypothetical protein